MAEKIFNEAKSQSPVLKEAILPKSYFRWSKALFVQEL